MFELSGDLHWAGRLLFWLTAAERQSKLLGSESKEEEEEDFTAVNIKEKRRSLGA
jgi:hypothetical protein